MPFNSSMASSQAPFFSSLIPINKKTRALSSQPKKFFTFKNSKIGLSKSENEPETQTPEEEDPIKVAFANAKSYKTNKLQSPLQQSFRGRIEGLTSNDKPKDAAVSKEVPLAVKLAMEKAKEYKKNKGVVDSEATSTKIFQNSVEESAEVDDKNEKLKSGEVIENGGGEKDVPLAVKIALEKAKEYKKNIGVADVSETSASELTGGNNRSLEEKKTIKDASKNNELTISSIDFVGLNFSDKKSGRGLPAGLVPISDPFPEGDWPEVEVLVGDASKFGDAAPSSNPIAPKEDDAELYKPKVTTWGLFPRPNDISKAYGGGRTLRPGEALESAEERAAKQAKTRKLLAAYKTKMGLNIDPKLKSDCEKALTEGDSLMDLGQLKEALPFYEKVMEKMVFQSELHGLAALQWSICQDSLNRSNEARVMYEKLQSHPSPKVSKKARQFVFGFQAMEMMKVRSSRRSPFTGYNKYFDAFVQEKATLSWQDAEVDEAGLNQAIPYVIFLASPILMVLLLAASKPH